MAHTVQKKVETSTKQSKQTGKKTPTLSSKQGKSSPAPSVHHTRGLDLKQAPKKQINQSVRNPGKVSKSTMKSSPFIMVDGSNPPKSFIEDILDTGKTVAKTVGGLAEGNPLSLLEVPNSIMKVIDTTSNIVRNVTKTDAKEKVVLTNEEIKSEGDKILLDKLKETMPVITTTQLPKAYSTSYSQQPLEVTQTVVNGREVTRVRGTYALPSMIDDNNSLSSRWEYSFRLTPTAPGVFGERVKAIADINQLWRLRSCTAQFIPTMGTDYVGNYYLNFMDGTDVASHYAGSNTFQQVSQRACAQPGTAREGTNLTYRPIDDSWYYCSNYGASDFKFFSPGTFGALLYNYKPTMSPNRVGYVLLIFDMEFTSAATAAYNYQNIMKSIFHSTWLSTCRYEIPFDQWLSVAWNIFSDLPERFKSCNQSSDSQLRSLYGSCNQDHIDTIADYNRFKKLGLDKVLQLMKPRSSESVLIRHVVENNPAVKLVHDKFASEFDDLMGVFGVQSFHYLKIFLVNFFKDSLILDQSFDFFLKIVRDSLKYSWKTYHPIKLTLPDPETDPESDEELDEITDEEIVIMK